MPDHEQMEASDDAMPVDVLGLQIDPASGISLVLLGRLEISDRVLPIFIGPTEAQAIGFALADLELDRPTTHDLFVAAIDATGATVSDLSIVALGNQTLIAELGLDTEHGARRIDARPSDGLALALRVGAPVTVRRQVFDAASVASHRTRHNRSAMTRSIASSASSGRSSTQRTRATSPTTPAVGTTKGVEISFTAEQRTSDNLAASYRVEANPVPASSSSRRRWPAMVPSGEAASTTQPSNALVHPWALSRKPRSHSSSIRRTSGDAMTTSCRARGPARTHESADARRREAGHLGQVQRLERVIAIAVVERSMERRRRGSVDLAGDTQYGGDTSDSKCGPDGAVPGTVGMFRDIDIADLLRVLPVADRSHVRGPGNVVRASSPLTSAYAGPFGSSSLGVVSRRHPVDRPNSRPMPDLPGNRLGQTRRILRSVTVQGETRRSPGRQAAQFTRPGDDSRVHGWNACRRQHDPPRPGPWRHRREPVHA